MHSEVVDHLRCLNVHAESWLVAAADVTEGRHIMQGVLGCPVCRAQYPIADGVADFTGVARAPLALEPSSAVTGDPELALKLAAMLDLTDASGYVLLCGAWGRLAHPLRELVPIQVIVVNVPRDVTMGNGVSGLLVGDRIPLAGGSARGVALDECYDGGGAKRSGAFIASAVSATRAGGRIVGFTTLPLPDGVTSTATDELHWVGARAGGQPVLKLVRAPR
jgi:uncharacterized protein YbaR (Trm112 family)